MIGYVFRGVKKAFCWLFNMLLDLIIPAFAWLVDQVPIGIRDAIDADVIYHIFEGVEVWLPVGGFFQLCGYFVGWKTTFLIFRSLFRLVRG